MHRLILTSSTWRQRSRVSTEHRATCEQVDPENRLLWRQTMRRLEAEAVRDAFLAVSGTLNPQLFGVSQAVARQKNGEVIVPGGADQNRRSIYIKIKRLTPETLLQVFDQPTMSVNCTQRGMSTVSTQALALLNGDTITRAATAFAERVISEQSDDPVERAVLTAFGRPTTKDEHDLLTQFFETQKAQYEGETAEADRGKPESLAAAEKKARGDLCHMLMSSNEFVYLD